MPSLLENRKIIIGLAKEAGLFEVKPDDNAFEKWYEVSSLIDQFEKEFFDSAKLQWAKKINFFRDFRGFIIGKITSLITGIIGSVVVQYLYCRNLVTVTVAPPLANNRTLGYI